MPIKIVPYDKTLKKHISRREIKRKLNDTIEYVCFCELGYAAEVTICGELAEIIERLNNRNDWGKFDD